jgi:hypothetical protein
MDQLQRQSPSAASNLRSKASTSAADLHSAHSSSSTRSIARLCYAEECSAVPARPELREPFGPPLPLLPGSKGRPRWAGILCSTAGPGSGIARSFIAASPPMQLVTRASDETKQTLEIFLKRRGFSSRLSAPRALCDLINTCGVASSYACLIGGISPSVRVCCQSLSATGTGSILSLPHHAASSPERCRSRWWALQTGTMNSSLTRRPIARGCVKVRWCESDGERPHTRHGCRTTNLR